MKKKTELSVDELLVAIKAPHTGEQKGKCVLIRKVETLPENYQEAIKIALDNKNVTSTEIRGFINGKTDIYVSENSVSRHRHRDGCVDCLYGVSK